LDNAALFAQETEEIQSDLFYLQSLGTLLQANQQQLLMKLIFPTRKEIKKRFGLTLKVLFYLRATIFYSHRGKTQQKQNLLAHCIQVLALFIIHFITGQLWTLIINKNTQMKQSAFITIYT